jgi:hypothetical protein
MREDLDGPSQVRRLLARAVLTLAAWLVAFLTVALLLTLFGKQVQALPFLLRALLISGVLVAFMVNMAMPVLSVAVARWVAGPAGPPRRRIPVPPPPPPAAEVAHPPADGIAASSTPTRSFDQVR